MRALILRVLLLAVLFNTAIGVPLHAAEHLRQGMAGIAALALAEAADDAQAEPDEREGLAHATCVWCASHAQLASALAFITPALPVLAIRAVEVAAEGTPFVAQPERWRFAARDPPSMS